MRPRLLPLIAACSLALSLIPLALGLRSLTRFELVAARYHTWPRPDEVRTTFVNFAWYSNTLRLELLHTTHPPAHFKRRETLAKFRASRPPGLHFAFAGEPATLEMNGYPPGFLASHYPYRNAAASAATGHRIALSVRPWLPILLTLVAPAIWWRRRRKAGARGFEVETLRTAGAGS